MQFKRPKLTSAHVISLIALFVALGGTVYAASSINGRMIQKGSIPGNRLKNDSLTRSQVNEASLDTVPRAAAADRATQANRATRADQADRATRADVATKADEASTAVTASGLAEGRRTTRLSDLQLSCQSGAVQGSVVVDTSQATRGAYRPFVGFNCDDQPIEVRQLTGEGRYLVRFLGNNAKNGTGIVTMGSIGFAAAAFPSADTEMLGGEHVFRVEVFDTKTGNLASGKTFTLVTL